MNYEQKYKEALEKAQIYRNHLLETGDDTNEIEYIFPELAKYEDEKIMEWIRKELESKYVVDNIVNNRMANKAFAWLEKQGEQDEINLVEILKHYPRETELYSPLYGKLWFAEVDEKHKIITCYKHHLEEGCTRAVLEQEDTVSFYSNGTTGLPDFTVSKDCMLFLYGLEKQNEQKPNNKTKPKFKVGDWVVNDKLECIYHIESVENNFYKHHYGTFTSYSEPTCRLWDITKDAKDGDVLISNESYVIFKEIDGLNIKCYCTYHYMNNPRFYVNTLQNKTAFYPATKEQRDFLFQKMHDAGYTWDAEKKELIKIM